MPPMDGLPPALIEARRLHDRGLWVVPCEGKRPIRPGWDKERLTRSELDKALSESMLNIAIVLSQSDMIDVECDSEEAEANLQAMFGGDVPRTPTYRSKRGHHRLFRRPSGLPDKAKLDLDGIEFRIAKKAALSVVPPSVHPDGPGYRWLKGLSIHEVEPAELPEAIVERLRAGGSQQAIHTDVPGAIPKGRRNDELFKLACKLSESGLDVRSIEAALLAENASRCKPPLPTAEVAGIAKSAKSRGSQSAQSNADSLLEIALADSELWKTPDGVAHATIRRNGHLEHWAVRSKGYKQWLTKQFYDRTRGVVGSHVVQDVLTTLEGVATFDGPVHPRHLRVAGHDGRIYLDLADDDWRAIEVDDSGWRIVDDPPVRFRRTPRMLPLPVPESGGSLAELRRFVNVTDEDWPLILAWLVAALRPDSSYPILKLNGEQGAAKSTLSRVHRAFVDPSTCPTRGAPKTERDLVIAAENGWVCAFDNLSYVSQELSDALCRLSTGGGFGVRTHYENDEETVFNAKRPIIVNGIEDVGTRSDLMDRSLLIELPRFKDEQRLPDSVLSREFEAACPRILGALLDAVSAALRNLPAVERSDAVWPRMADFAQWSVAAEEALGLEPGEFMRAYSNNRNSANQTALESSPIVPQLRFTLARLKGSFEGTATALLEELSCGMDTRPRDWPKNARALSGLLSRLAPNLRLTGMKVERFKIDNKKLWRIEAAPRPTPPKAGPPVPKLRPPVPKSGPPTPKNPPSANPQNPQKIAPKPKGGASGGAPIPRPKGGLSEEVRAAFERLELRRKAYE
ncbi:MAG: bifunctional DNA primase/polymerase [Gemmataceae bacterium]